MWRRDFTEKASNVKFEPGPHNLTTVPYCPVGETRPQRNSLGQSQERKRSHARLRRDVADNSSAKCGTSSYEMTRGLSCSIRAARFDSAAASSFVASFAVLEFEPHATMPPSNNDTAAAISPRSDRIAPNNIPAKRRPPPATAIRETRMNLRQLSTLAASSSMCSSRRTISPLRGSQSAGAGGRVGYLE